MIDRRSAVRRLAFGFVTGCVLLLLVWAARGLASSAPASARQPTQTRPAATDDVKTPAATKGEAPPSAEPAQPSAGAAKKTAWNAQPAGARQLPGASVSPLEVGGMLVVVVILLVAGVLLLKRVLRRTRLVPGGRKVLALVDALPLGPRRQVYVVDLQGRTLVLGAGGENVTLLAEYGEDEWSAGVQLQNPLVTADAGVADAGEAAEAGQGDSGRRTRPAAGRARVPGAARPAGPAPAGRLARALEAYRGKLAEASGDDPTDGRPGPPGASRVPPSFRHLLDKAAREEAGKA